MSAIADDCYVGVGILLQRLVKLDLLHVRSTKVTAKGIDELAKALQWCKIEWDGGTIEPAQK